MKILILLIGWIVGIATMGRILSPEFLGCAIWVWLITLMFFLLSLSHFQIRKNNIFNVIYLISIGLSASFLGQSYAQHALDNRLNQRIIESAEFSSIVYISKIDESSQDSNQQLIKQRATALLPNNQHVDLMLYDKIHDVEANNSKVVNHSNAMKLKPNVYELGHYYQVVGSIKPAHSYAVDGVFDVEKWLLQQNIMGTVSVRSVQPIAVEQIILEQPTFVQEQDRFFSKIKLGIEKYRLEIRHFIENQPLTNKGLILALLTADESLLSESVQAQFKLLGISHLLAISGPHVLIFAGLFCFILNLLISKFRPEIFLKIPRPYFLVLPFLMCVMAYTALVGFEIPAMRTFLTVVLVSVAVVLNQKIHALKLLLLSASILLWFDPFSILSAAFWLSYGACFILIRVYQTIQQNVTDGDANRETTFKSKVWVWSKVLIESQWKVFLALFPLVALIFQQVSWISPLVNLIAIPLIGAVIVPLEIIATVVSWISEPLGILFFYLADVVVSFLLVCLKFIEHIFHPQLSWLALTPLIIFSVALGLLILFLPRAVVPKWWSLFCFFPIVFSQQESTDFSLTVLDVGQGQAIFLHSNEQNILIDTGGAFDETKFSVGRQIMLPFLFGQGISKLDQVYLTHLDQDHAGAFASIVQAMEIKNVFSNEKDQRFNGQDFQYCYAGQTWQNKGMKFEVLSPLKEDLVNIAGQQNEMSCVIYIQVQTASKYQNFLLMGDAGWETEYHLLQAYPNLKVDVLVLGHHGSQHSSSFGFLKQLQPKLAIVSAGYDNRYNHPHPIVIERLKALSIPFISTIRQGSIKFELNKDQQMNVEYYRQQRAWLIRSP